MPSCFRAFVILFVQEVPLRASPRAASQASLSQIQRTENEALTNH